MVGLRVAGSEIGRVAPGARRGEDLMAQAAQKITLSSSGDIPFDNLVLSQSSVRRNKAGVSVDELADDIARRGLLQGLSVRPVLDADGVETGKFEIPDGGRRFQALSLLVKQKRLAKTAPVPCVLRDVASDILAEDDSLAENMQRVALHPLDQFRALEKKYSGQDEYPEEIDTRLGELESAMEAFEQRPLIFDAAKVGRAGVFVTLDRDGDLAVYRGYVRPEDEPREETVANFGDELGAEGQGALSEEVLGDQDNVAEIDLPAFLMADLPLEGTAMLAAE